MQTSTRVRVQVESIAVKISAASQLSSSDHIDSVNRIITTKKISKRAQDTLSEDLILIGIRELKLNSSIRTQTLNIKAITNGSALSTRIMVDLQCRNFQIESLMRGSEYPVILSFPQAAVVTSSTVPIVRTNLVLWVNSNSLPVFERIHLALSHAVVEYRGSHN